MGSAYTMPPKVVTLVSGQFLTLNQVSVTSHLRRPNACLPRRTFPVGRVSGVAFNRRGDSCKSPKGLANSPIWLRPFLLPKYIGTKYIGKQREHCFENFRRSSSGNHPRAPVLVLISAEKLASRALLVPLVSLRRLHRSAGRRIGDSPPMAPVVAVPLCEPHTTNPGEFLSLPPPCRVNPRDRPSDSCGSSFCQSVPEPLG